MEFYDFTVDDLKESEKFLKSIAWDLTPKKFIAPGNFSQSPQRDEFEGVSLMYMLYVDLLHNKPKVMIMKIRGGMSNTAGCIEGIPEELLKEAMDCDTEECPSGMYPLTDKLRDWLKKELGLA